MCVCVKQQAVMTQDKGSATITERLETETETVTQAGGSGPLIKSTEFQVYHLESTQAPRAFLYSAARQEKHVESC